MALTERLLVGALSILPLVVSGHSSFAQVVRGTVVQVDTRHPIGAVRVQWLDSSVGTVTTSSGAFVLPRLPGAGALQLNAAGYAPLVHAVPTGDGKLSISMTPSALLRAQSMTVTAQRSDEKLFDVPQAVTVVSNDELRENVVRTAPEALTNQPGIWVQKTTHGGGSPVIRGLVGNQILLLVDGIRLNNSTYRYGPNQYLSGIDPGMTDRIEAVRGSGSVLYGSDALGGVVQVLSKTPSFSEDGLRALGRVSGQWMSGGMEASGRADLELAGERVAFLAGFSERHYGDVIAGGDLGTLSPTGYGARTADAKLLLRTGSFGLLTAAFQHSTQDDVPRYDQVALGGYSTNNYDPQTRQLAYLKWETFSTNRWVQSFRATGSFDRSVEGLFARKSGSARIRTQRDEVGTFGFVAEVTSAPLPGWQAQAGVELYAGGVDSSATETDTASDTSSALRGSYADGSNSWSLAAFTNHQVQWNGFRVSAGVRFNAVAVAVEDALFGNQDVRSAALVGQVGVLYDLAPWLRAVLSGNTGFRAPNVDDLSRFGAVESTVFEIPSSSLAPERSRTVEAGLKLSGKNAFGAVTAYQTHLSGLIDRVPATYGGSDVVDGRNVYQKQNVGEALIRGIEAEADVSISPRLRASGSLTWTWGENRNTGTPMRRIPPLFATAGLLYRHAAGWWLKGELATAGEQDRLSPGDRSDFRISSRLVDGIMPGWTCWNLHAGTQIRSVRIQATLQNLFDEAYRVYASGVDEYGRSARLMLVLDL
jgi:outer membrane receptor protein involved in Fe transport